MMKLDKQQDFEPRIGTYLNILKKDELLYRTAIQCITELDDPEDQMYAVCWAPALVRYIAWVLEEAVRDRKKRLYFLARDAYPMYLVAKALTEKMNIPIEIRYLRVSRYSLRIPEYHLLGEKCLDRIFLSGIDVSLYQIWKRAGLNNEEIDHISEELHCDRILHKNLNPREIAEFKQYVRQCCREHKTDLLKMIYERSKVAYDNTLSYLKREGLLEPVRYGVVDSGWVGTIQQSLRNILAQTQPEIQITGYYFGLYALPGERSGCLYKAYFFQPQGHIRRKVEFSNCLYEVMYSEPCPMVKGYTGERHEPVFSEINNPNKENLQRNHRILEHYMEVFTHIAKISGGVNKGQTIAEERALSTHESNGRYEGKGDHMVQQLYRTVMATPNAWEAALYGSQLFSDDLADDHMRKIANDLSQSEIRNLRITRKFLIMLGLLHQELHESGWIEGSIVNAKNNIAVNLRAARRAKYLTYLRQSVKARKQRIK